MKRFAPILLLAACTTTDDAGVGGGKADGFGLTDAEAAAVVDLVDYASPTLVEEAGVSTTVATAIVAHRAGADGTLNSADDDDFISVDELANVSGVNGSVVAKLRTYATAHAIVELEQAVRAALHTGDIPRAIDAAEAVSIVQSPAASAATEALAAFYVHTPQLWAGDPWLGEGPRTTPVFDADADQIVLDFLKTHGFTANDLLLRKFRALPPKELPTPPHDSATHARAITAVWNGATSPVRAEIDPFGDWTAHYYVNNFTTGSVEYLQFSQGSFHLDLQGHDLASDQLVLGAASGDPSLSVAYGSWTGSARCRWRILELVMDPVTNHVERALVAWNRLEDLRFGMEPGYLVYNARDPQTSWTYPSDTVGLGSTKTYGPYRLAPGTTFNTSVAGPGGGDVDLAIKIGTTVACSSTNAGSTETCQVTATTDPVRVVVSGKQTGSSPYTLSLTGTPAPR